MQSLSQALPQARIPLVRTASPPAASEGDQPHYAPITSGATTTDRLPQAGGGAGGEAAAEGGASGLVSFRTKDTSGNQTVASHRLQGEQRQAAYAAKRAINPFPKGSYTCRTLEGSTVTIDPRVQRSSRCRKTLLNTARLLTKQMQARKHRYRVAFLTLTYAKVDGYSPGHVHAFMTHLRNWLTRRGIPCCGLRKLEMQKRGAVHHHLMIWLPKGVTLPKPDKRGWWPHGLTNCQWLRNGYGYAAKYVSKAEQDTIPKGARLYSVFGLDPDQKTEVSWWITPKYVREAFPLDAGHRPIRAKGGGWISRLTGEMVYSEWQFGGIVRVSLDGKPATGWVRLVESDRRPKVSVDHAAGVKVMDELRFWEAAGNALLYQSDRMAWLSKFGLLTEVSQ